MSSSDNKSYFASGLASLSPWPARSSVSDLGGASAETPAVSPSRGRDHVVSHRHRLSLRQYPPDCPPLEARWFYAVDVPKRKPTHPAQPSRQDKPPVPPKKFVIFSDKDSRSIETAFNKLAAEEDAHLDHGRAVDRRLSGDRPGSASSSGAGANVKVPVNEDYLFDVDIQERELAPAYWLGPVYEVRRGTWFYQEGSNLRPCDENLSIQLEEGYLKVKPFRSTSHVRSASQPRPASSSGADDSSARPEPSVESSKRSVDDLQIRDEVGHVKDARGPAGPSASKQPSPTPTAGQKTHRLFGAHMNSIVTYQDAKTAWILTDDFLSRMSSNVYQRLVGGGYLGGIKLVRGYSEMNKPKDVKADATQKRGADGSTAAAAGEGDGLQRRERAAAAEAEAEAEGGGASPAGARSGGDRPSTPDVDALPRSKIRAIEREMSDLVSSANAPDPEQQEEEARKRDEKEIRDDYRDNAEDQGREIEHLVLVTHGIGQRLGLRMESVNFVHDVNVLRKTIKDVYGSSPDLQALNAEVDKTHKNSGIQVLPVCWRHLLDFPRQATRPNRAEHDLADAAALDDDDDDDDDGDEEQYPSLDDITVEGVPAVRNLVTDLALDILLYQSAYCEHISRIVQRECNRIYQLFVARNPGFKGHVSLVGHSLGSAILFDVLCRQSDSRSRRSAPASRQDRSDPAEKQKTTTTKGDIELDFDADAFVCLGSPIGLFQMLKGHTIAARRNTQRSDGLHGAAPSRRAFGAGGNPLTNIVGGDDADTQRLPVTVSSPKCAQLYNIFHPTDPIGYRIEPLISTAMSSLRPQPLPYTKKGIFGAPVGQGLSGIGARVGQSVSGLWTTLSSGIATSILNRSLGISGEDFTSRAGTQPPARLSGALVEPSMSMGAGTNISAGNVIATSTDVIKAAEARAQMEDKKRKLGDDISSSAASAAPGTAPLAAEGASAAGEHASTLMDTEIETLYAGFQKRRKSHQSDDGRDLGESAEWSALEERARKLRAEDRKVRALNANGRVDYSIQEGVFDISLIASIASHLSYWADEDVSHFVISQLLSRHRVSSEEGASSSSSLPQGTSSSSPPGASSSSPPPGKSSSSP